MQEWEYPRKDLIYLKELGEGEFGKVLLMKAQVGIYTKIGKKGKKETQKTTLY